MRHKEYVHVEVDMARIAGEGCGVASEILSPLANRRPFVATPTPGRPLVPRTVQSHCTPTAITTFAGLRGISATHLVHSPAAAPCALHLPHHPRKEEGGALADAARGLAAPRQTAPP